MKKITCLFLAVVVLFIFFGCARDEEEIGFSTFSIRPVDESGFVIKNQSVDVLFDALKVEQDIKNGVAKNFTASAVEYMWTVRRKDGEIFYPAGGVIVKSKVSKKTFSLSRPGVFRVELEVLSQAENGKSQVRAPLLFEPQEITIKAGTGYISPAFIVKYPGKELTINQSFGLEAGIGKGNVEIVEWSWLIDGKSTPSGQLVHPVLNDGLDHKISLIASDKWGPYEPVAYTLTATKELIGIQGPQGLTGATGLKGDFGATGPAGNDGINGKDGTNGVNGVDGKNGTNGIDGKNGKDGVDGKDGTNGIDGKDGVVGPQGPTGKDGVIGPKGDSGATGPAGKDGVDGKDGVVGPQGPTGPAGKDGVNGIDGKDGTNGKDGTGTNGIDGKDGKDGKDGAVGTTSDIQQPEKPEGVKNIIVSLLNSGAEMSPEVNGFVGETKLVALMVEGPCNRLVVGPDGIKVGSDIISYAGIEPGPSSKVISSSEKDGQIFLEIVNDSVLTERRVFAFLKLKLNKVGTQKLEWPSVDNILVTSSSGVKLVILATPAIRVNVTQ